MHVSFNARNHTRPPNLGPLSKGSADCHHAWLLDTARAWYVCEIPRALAVSYLRSADKTAASAPPAPAGNGIAANEPSVQLSL